MIKIEKVWISEDRILIETSDGRHGSELISDYPRLRNATLEELNSFDITPYGLRWETLDEDLSFEGFFQEKKRSSLYAFFINHPELNASAIARSLGIAQELFAQYINGQKSPTTEELKGIKEKVKSIGLALLEAPL